MLMRFLIENHQSFREPAELSFVATARKDTPDLRFPSHHAPHGVLPVVGVWGANASGKSNLLHGLLFLCRAVELSDVGQAATAPVQWSPWRLQRGEGAPPTRMELDFLMGETRVHFGFRVDDRGFIEEWLYQWEGSRRQVLYHRDRTQDPGWYFGPSLKGRRADFAAETRDNSLYLSAAAQRNHPQLLPIHQAITQGIGRDARIGLTGHPTFSEDEPFLTPDLQPVLLRLIRAADLGITGIRIEEHEKKPDLPIELERVFQPEFVAKLANRPVRKRMRLIFQRGQPGDLWELPPESESRGTQIFLARITDVFNALRTGRLLVMDEIDTSLHPDLCIELVRLFTDPTTNPHRAQLLFATHDRDLLEHLRTDEVVLVDKGADGASMLRTASDYKGLRTRDDLRRVHAQGRLGGVPTVGHFGAALSRGLSK
jgi:hypothetical protein